MAATAGATKLADTDLEKRILTALKKASITTLGDLAARTRQQVTVIGGLDAYDLGAIEKVMQARFIAYKDTLGAYSTCDRCPACENCGMPRATEARNVVVDLRGRAKHAQTSGDPCDGCNAHHRQLVAAAATAA